MNKPQETAEFELVERNDALNFAHRTRTNLLQIEEIASRGDSVHPVTQLVNSLLGLVIFLREQKFLGEIQGLSLSGLEKKGWPAWQSSVDKPNSLGQLVRHLRNATAHGGIKFSSDSKNLDEVRFEFTDRDPKTLQITWKGSIAGTELRKFVLHIVDELDQRIG